MSLRACQYCGPPFRPSLFSMRRVSSSATRFLCPRPPQKNPAAAQKTNIAMLHEAPPPCLAFSQIPAARNREPARAPARSLNLRRHSRFFNIPRMRESGYFFLGARPAASLSLSRRASLEGAS